MDRWERWLREPVSGASLGVLRMGFGAVMLFEALWFLGFAPGAPRDPNLVESMFTGSHVQWTFSYPGFGWIQPLPEPWTTAVFVALGVASTLLIVGWFSRAAAAVVFSCFAYANLMDASFYLNHFYLACLIALLLVFLPAGQRFCLPAAWRKRDETQAIPGWTIWLLRVQVLIVYFYAGLAKLGGDWLAGEPLRRWLPHPSTLSQLEPWIGADMTATIRHWVSQESAVMAISYGGLVFDLTIGFLLLWRRTRPYAFTAAVLFHVSNSLLFHIGAFPFLAVLLTTLFLEPDWPDRLQRRFRRSMPGPSANLSVGNVTARYAMVFAAIWLVVQIVVPLRHLVLPGDVNWTEEGHRFSWRMKLRDKVAGPFHLRVDGLTTQLPSAGTPTTFDQPVYYRTVNATAVDWARLPELVVVYEPLLGERIVFNPMARSTWMEAAAVAREHWYNTTGRPLKLVRTRSLEATLAALDGQLAVAQRQGRPQAADALATLRQLRWLLNELKQPDADEPYLQFQAQEKLRELAGYSSWRKPILGMLWQTSPFACQAAPASDAPFMVVGNPEVLLPDDSACSRIDRSQCPDLGEVLVDLNRLIPAHWQSLPEQILCIEAGGEVTTYWNYAHELHAAQIAALQASPLLQHQYAWHVAERIQRQTGRRPQVYVTSHVKLNQHTMQPMVDPRVDLAASSYRLFGHHGWILPLHRPPGSAYVASVHE